MRRATIGLAAAVGMFVAAIAPLAVAKTYPISPSLRAQARELYGPVNTYEHTTTSKQRAASRVTARRVGRMLDRCDKPYLNRIVKQRSAAGRKLYQLWNDASELQTSEGYTQPVVTQLGTLAKAWAGLSLRSRPMNGLVHGLAREFQLTLDAPAFDTCGFVRGIAAHHYSYAWARTSADGVEAAHWWHAILRAANLTNAFWPFVGNTGLPSDSSAPGAHLFTKAQLIILSNLPGELS